MGPTAEKSSESRHGHYRGDEAGLTHRAATMFLVFANHESELGANPKGAPKPNASGGT